MEEKGSHTHVFRVARHQLTDTPVVVKLRRILRATLMLTCTQPFNRAGLCSFLTLVFRSLTLTASSKRNSYLQRTHIQHGRVCVMTLCLHVVLSCAHLRKWKHSVFSGISLLSTLPQCEPNNLGEYTICQWKRNQWCAYVITHDGLCVWSLCVYGLYDN